ncbi:MAG: YcbK family protein [Methylobacterium mesophilicum]|nr:YcbK family protein [Methylobacterium mesophilicum]
MAADAKETAASGGSAAKRPGSKDAAAIAAVAKGAGTGSTGGDAPIATGPAAIAAFAGSSVLASSQTDQPAAGNGAHANQTMFASLYAQSRAKTPIRNADLGKTRRVILPRQGAPIDAGGSALPGVRNASSLFEIGQKASADYDADILDEASGEEGVYQTASISGLARLAPNGLMVQRPDVQTSCFQPELVSIIRAVETRFHTKVVVTSGYRSPSHNLRVNGAKRSMHLQCKAADILVPNADKFQVANYVRTLPNRGGVGTYCHTAAIHVDTGRQRDWNWACRRTPSANANLILASQKTVRSGSDD